MGSEAWPLAGLEPVAHCPYCGNGQRSLAFHDVQDWAFGSAPGRWTYWDCNGCHALYLDPRPTPDTIGLAYARYYTHAAAAPSVGSRAKERLRNELWFHTLGADLAPRLHLPWPLAFMMPRLRRYVAEPFGLRDMAQLPKGLLVDVGCGNGDKLALAHRLGWRTLGLELDTAAAQTAQARGLDVRQGGYTELACLTEQADCIVCSHVLEHVHQPLQMLRLLRAALKPEGTLLLSTPNSQSHLREHYGRYWRGLEAPRHLAIASHDWLKKHLQALGLDCTSVASMDLECAVESERMRRSDAHALAQDVRNARQALARNAPVPLARGDATQLVCRLSMAGDA